jgi:hypothetical protein
MNEWGGACKARILKVKPGHMVIFRQDLMHAGSGYTEENMRWFTYLDLAGLKRKGDHTSFQPFPVNLKNFDDIGYSHHV